jgi:hypothetical protein
MQVERASERRFPEPGKDTPKPGTLSMMEWQQQYIGTALCSRLSVTLNTFRG